MDLTKNYKANSSKYETTNQHLMN